MFNKHVICTTLILVFQSLKKKVSNFIIESRKIIYWLSKMFAHMFWVQVK